MNAPPLHDQLLELNYQLTIQPIGEHCSILAEIGIIEENLISLCGLSVEAVNNAISAKLPDYARKRMKEYRSKDRQLGHD